MSLAQNTNSRKLPDTETVKWNYHCC